MGLLIELGDCNYIRAFGLSDAQKFDGATFVREKAQAVVARRDSASKSVTALSPDGRAQGGSVSLTANTVAARDDSAPKLANRTLTTVSQAEAYAAALHLLSRSEAHRTMPLWLVDAMVRGALHLGQIKLYRRRGAPAGLALWAYLSEEIEQRVLSGGTGLHPQELNAGDRLWIIDIVAPDGEVEAIRKDLVETLFAKRDYREMPISCVQRNDHGALARSSASPVITYRPARREDIVALAPRLRRGDVEEIRIRSGDDPASALYRSFDNAKRCWSVVLNGSVVAMFGVGHLPNRAQEGLVWMLGSNEVFRQRRALLLDAPIWLSEMLKGHVSIGNYIHAENKTYIRWLKRMGFRFVHLHKGYGLQKKSFWQFVITRAELVCPPEIERS